MGAGLANAAPFMLGAAGAGARGITVGRQEADAHNQLMQTLDLQRKQEGRQEELFPGQLTGQRLQNTALQGQESRASEEFGMKKASAQRALAPDTRQAGFYNSLLTKGQMPTMDPNTPLGQQDSEMKIAEAMLKDERAHQLALAMHDPAVGFYQHQSGEAQQDVQTAKAGIKQAEKDLANFMSNPESDGYKQAMAAKNRWTHALRKARERLAHSQGSYAKHVGVDPSVLGGETNDYGDVQDTDSTNPEL